MCLAKFSAQTEQMAAIFRRCGDRPSCLQQRLGLRHDP